MNNRNVLIIRKNGEYLVALPYPDTLVTRWSISPWDGYRMTDSGTADQLAKRVGGVVAEFNTLTGRVKA